MKIILKKGLTIDTTRDIIDTSRDERRKEIVNVKMKSKSIITVKEWRRQNQVKKYVVIEHGFRGNNLKDWTDPASDDWEHVYDTLGDANKAAEDMWAHSRRKHWAVEVFCVTEADLYDDAIDDETGEVDWLAYHSLGFAPDGAHKYCTDFRLIVVDEHGYDCKFATISDKDSDYTLDDYLWSGFNREDLEAEIADRVEDGEIDLEDGYSFDGLLEAGRIKLIPEVEA